MEDENNSDETLLRNQKQKDLFFNAIMNGFTNNPINSKTSLTKKDLKTFSFISIIVIVFAVSGFFIFYNYSSNEQEPESLKTGFLIQNLRGDTVDTWVSWKIVEGDVFHVHVVDSQYATKERLDAILGTIMSTEKLEIDDSLLHKGPKGSTSTYYAGWEGALNSINSVTASPIPKNLHFHVTDKGEGDVLIELTNLSHPDGVSGFTTSVIDENEHQILKAKITIYNIERLSISQLKTIVLHELGHAFGLAHSSAPEDLMAPVITTAYPYISECDLDAITLLYNGGQKSAITCEQ